MISSSPAPPEMNTRFAATSTTIVEYCDTMTGSDTACSTRGAEALALAEAAGDAPSVPAAARAAITGPAAFREGFTDQLLKRGARCATDELGFHESRALMTSLAPMKPIGRTAPGRGEPAGSRPAD